LWRQDFILSILQVENLQPHGKNCTHGLKTCTHKRLGTQLFSDRSFLDMLVTLRQASVRQHVLAMAHSGHRFRKLIRLLENAVAMAV